MVILVSMDIDTGKNTQMPTHYYWTGLFKTPTESEIYTLTVSFWAFRIFMGWFFRHKIWHTKCKRPILEFHANDRSRSITLKHVFQSCRKKSTQSDIGRAWLLFVPKFDRIKTEWIDHVNHVLTNIRMSWFFTSTLKNMF